MNQSRASKVESFLKAMGNDTVWSCHASARMEYPGGEDSLIISFNGVGPDDVFVGLVVITDSSMKSMELVSMNGEITVVPISDETPMENPWVESIVEWDEGSAEIVREYIGAM